jgi:hypothetical protein
VKLELAAATLPTLLTDCVIVGHAKKADVVFTKRQWFAMCAHMRNENPANFFLMPYRDNKGNAKFAKAYTAKADDRIHWAWDTITHKAKSPASIGFYPTNAQRESRWAGMDFDIHDNDRMRARDFALKAFSFLYCQPQLFVALTTSAGDPIHSGWHLFIFTADFFPCDDWTRLLRQVADQIGAPIKPGVCEIFPDDCCGIGRGIRAPGTWNPKNGQCGLILHETFSKILPACISSAAPKEKYASLDARCNTTEQDRVTPNRVLFRGEHGEWRHEFAITAPSTRHQKLLKLVGAAFLQVGRKVARRNAELQYDEAAPTPAASLIEHLTEFEQMWAGMERKWKAKLALTERDKFHALSTENDRDAFRVLRNWSQTDKPDFKVHCESLARRLGVTLKTAANIRSRFCRLDIMHKTAEYVPHKLAARYGWIAVPRSRRMLAITR